MLSEQAISAQNSIIELHKWIEDIFTGRKDHLTALKRVIESFHSDFAMITMQGQSIGLSDVETMFRNNIGSRPQLHIEIDSYETLQISEHTALCRYRETHHNGQEVRARWSVVSIVFQNGQPLWRYLHETAILEPN